MRKLQVGVSSMKVVAWSPARDQIAVGGTVAPAKIVDAQSGKVTSTLEGITTYDMSWSPDGKSLAVAVLSKAETPTDTLRIWDAVQNRWQLSTNPTGNAGSVAWSHDGKRVAVGTGTINDDGTVSNSSVTLYDTGNWTVDAVLPYSDTIDTLAWSSDDKKIAAISGFFMNNLYSVVVFDATAHGGSSVLHEIPVGSNNPLSVKWSPVDPNTFAVGFGDGTIKIFDAGTGQATNILKHNTNGVQKIAWSPDGKRLASAGHDAIVKVWDVSAGQELKLLSQPALVDDLSWSADSSQLAVACDNGEVWVWDGK